MQTIIFAGQMTGRIYASNNYVTVNLNDVPMHKAISKDDVTREAIVAVWDHLRGCKGCADCQDYRIAIVKAIAGEHTLENVQ